MLNPDRSAISAQDPVTTGQSTTDVVALVFSGHSVRVTHDGFTIGSSENCDLTLDDSSLPGLHSVVHMQSGAVWIEVADENLVLTVNGRSYRRMALRHEDRMMIGTLEITILMNSEISALPEKTILEDDLTLLTAEELCDRILADQSMVSDFIEGQRSGWEALLRAIESANVEPAITNIATEENSAQDEEPAALNSLLEQIQDLNHSINVQAEQLSEQEKQLIESASLIEESQNRAVQQLDEILEKLQNSDPPHELRASA